MANAEHLATLQQGVDAWNAWREKEPWFRPDLSKVGLIGANLHQATLFGANLSEANLSKANLEGADLHAANLSKANLSEADLSKADLREANLRGANLSGTQLGAANLSRATLGGTNLNAALLNDVFLGDIHLSGANLRGTHLGEKDLGVMDLREVDLGEMDLRWVNLGGANLSGANLSGANLSGTHLGEANLSRANLSGANLSGMDLRRLNLGGANLSRANLSEVDLSGMDLREMDLSGANLMRANLIDAYLDGADLTGAKLWETQRGGWSIKNVICQVAFWDREGQEPTKYEEGEFERIFAEKPRIILRYAGGVSPIDLLALPLIVERLQAQYPGSALQIRSMQNDAGGASITITVEDLADRSPEAFGQEFVRIQAQLECVVKERDRLERRLDWILSQGISKITEFLALPRETHIHDSRAPIAIGGPAVSKGDTNINTGQAAAVGRSGHVHDSVFQQNQTGIDLPKLAEELGRLRAAMKGETTGAPEHDEAIGAVAGAEKAAAKSDGPAVLQYLKSAGEWTFGIAEKIGVPLAVEALKRAM